LQCVVVPALLCSMLQCVAVCCSVLQCVAVCCIVLQCVAVCCSPLHCVYQKSAKEDWILRCADLLCAASRIVLR